MKEKHIGNWFYRHLLFCRRKNGSFNKALTLIELLIAMAIVGVLSAIAVPVYTDYITDTKNATAKADIANIESQIERFRALNGRPPNNFAEASINPVPKDPWGRLYQYLRIEGVSPQPSGIRKDHSTVPLNSDYDLYSIGADGLTDPALTGGSIEPTRVRIKTKEGKVFIKQVDIPLGSPQKPFSQADIRRKLKDCNSVSIKPLSDETLEKLIETIQRLEEFGDVGPVLSTLFKE